MSKMESERAAEGAEPLSMRHPATMRASAPPIPRETPDISRPHTSPAVEHPGNDVWTGAITRLQAQVSYNTGMLDAQRRKLSEVETRVDNALTRVGQEMHLLATSIETLRAKPTAIDSARNDPADLEVLAGNLQRLTSRVNEVDGLSMQLDLLKNRLKRLEDGPAVSVVDQRAETYFTRQDVEMRDAHPPQHTVTRQQQPPQHQPLPSMRTASGPILDEGWPPRLPPNPAMEAQASQGYRSSIESRDFPGELLPSRPTTNPGVRPEPLPPPSALSGWRPADQYHPSAALASSGLPALRSQTIKPEPQASGWAPVNVNQANKRALGERLSPAASPLLEGSKRPRLAPLMPIVPRHGFSDEGYAPMQSSFQQAASAAPQFDGRTTSDGSQLQLSTTPTALGPHNYRFITSGAHAEPQESWRSDPERVAPPQVAPAGGRGGRGRGSRGGRGRGRSRAQGQGPASAQDYARHGSQELGASDVHQSAWMGSQASPHAPYQPLQPYSPQSVFRRADSYTGAPADRSLDTPATPSQASPPQDPYAESINASGSKKTRTKPIRNADGILIRKDGRPDMRSVSSANNLRKVHAKKEAEKAETGEEGDESASPTSAAAVDADENEPDTQSRHRELMSRIFPRGVDATTRSNMAEQFFPRHQESRLLESGNERREAADHPMTDSASARPEAPPQHSRLSRDSAMQSGGDEQATYRREEEPDSNSAA